MNIDIHCHSSSKPIMKNVKNKNNLFKGFSFSPDASIFKKLQKLLEKSTGIYQKTQSNFDNLYKGGIRVACISFTPLEKGFNIMNSSQTGFFNDILRDIAKKKKSEYLITPKFINALSGYDNDEISKVQDSLTDYYLQMLKPEYDYITSFQNQTNTVGSNTYTIRFPKNATELTKYLKDDSNLNIIFTIEGAHSLMPAPTNRDVYLGQRNKLGDTSNQINHDLQSILKHRIDEMKNNWIAKPLFISLNHHFWNGLGGHAASLGRLITGLVSQQEGINTGLTANGEVFIKELLSGNSIYLDVKHMSPKSRKRYYELLSNDKDLKNKKIPIVCSHTGISSIATLQKMIGLNEEQAQNDKNNFLFESGINLCTEELKYILDSNGIIGIQLDEKRISGKHAVKDLKSKYEAKNKLWLLYIKLVWANIFQGVRALNTKKAWDLFAIGSDYDGLINHLDEYPTSANLNTLRKDMMDFLTSKDNIVEMDFSLTRDEINSLMFGYNAEEITTKIFEGNALTFMKNWF